MAVNLRREIQPEVQNRIKAYLDNADKKSSFNFTRTRSIPNQRFLCCVLKKR